MFSKRIEQLNPYVPGEQPEGNFIKLNANENPYAPPKAVVKELSKYAVQHSMNLALYPDPESEDLRQSIADMLNESRGFLHGKDELPFSVTKENIFCSNGSDELLSFLFYAFFDSDKNLILPELTYSFYPVYADYYSIPIKKIPLLENWSLDKTTMLEEAKDSTGMIFANPNAPTGIALTVLELDEMLQNYPTDKIMIVDEAYVDFSKETALPLLEKYKNLIIVRTFSKSFSLAGMRLGYCVAHTELIDAIMKVKNSFNHFPVDALTQKCGQLVCKNWNYFAETSQTIAITRDNFSTTLKRTGWDVIHSNSNFIMVRKLSGESGLEVYEEIKKHNFLVRYFDNPKTKDWVRITIGKPADMMKLASIMCEKIFQ